MKYINNKLTKLICVILSLVLPLALFACGGTDEENSPSEKVSLSPALTAESAVKLIEQDRLITEIFVCNSLCDASHTVAERTLVSEESPYASFSEIESLINSTYVKDSGGKEFFLSYPKNNEPSVINQGGKTSVFNHIGSSYTDFADTASVSVADTENESIKIINARTVTGKEIQFKAILENEKWLLEKGIYRVNPPEETAFYNFFSKSGVGSFSKLSGNILVIELFISDAESGFTEAEEETCHNKIAAVADRLAIQASDYGLTPNFVYESAYFEHENVLGTEELDFNIMMAETGFGTLQNFAEANYDISAYDGYFFAVFINKNIETSAGIYDNTEDTELYYGERILIGTSAAEYQIYRCMLEMLGAYGYDQLLLDEYTESLYRFYFPTDCMLMEDMSLSVMSPVTAYSCGVTDKLDILYRVFIPNK